MGAGAGQAACRGRGGWASRPPLAGGLGQPLDLGRGQKEGPPSSGELVSLQPGHHLPRAAPRAGPQAGRIWLPTCRGPSGAPSQRLGLCEGHTCPAEQEVAGHRGQAALQPAPLCPQPVCNTLGSSCYSGCFLLVPLSPGSHYSPWVGKGTLHTDAPGQSRCPAPWGAGGLGAGPEQGAPGMARPARTSCPRGPLREPLLLLSGALQPGATLMPGEEGGYGSWAERCRRPVAGPG